MATVTVMVEAQAPDTAVASATVVALAAMDAGSTDMEEVAEAVTVTGRMSGTASVARAGADPGALCRQVVDMASTRVVAATAVIIKQQKRGRQQLQKKNPPPPLSPHPPTFPLFFRIWIPINKPADKQVTESNQPKKKKVYRLLFFSSAFKKRLLIISSLLFPLMA